MTTTAGRPGALDVDARAEEGAVATAPAPACGWTCPAAGGRSAPIRAKTATATAAASPPLRPAEATGREIRCRPRRARPPGRGWPEAASVSAEEAARTGGADGRTVLGKAGDDRFGEPAGLGLDGTHLVKHLASGGPVARVLSQAAPDQLSQFGGHAAKVRGAVDQPVHERGVRPGTERSLACGGEGEHRAQAEQVAGRADIRAQGLFGGHEPGRADHSGRCSRLRSPRRPGQSRSR